MSTKKIEQKSGLSTTSLILSIIGLLASLTIVGVFLGIPMALVGLVFGIIALIKKQKKGLAIAGIIIGGIVTLITITIVIISTIFIKNNADVILTPINEMANMMENDPQLATMMNDPVIQVEFEELFKSKLAEKFGENLAENENFDNRENIKTQIPAIFDEMKNTMLELKEKYNK